MNGQNRNPGRHALLVGATGLVGRYLLVQLLADRAYGQVTVLARRPLPQQHPKLKVHVLDFERLPDYKPLIRGDDLFCALGTTLKKAGSRAAFEHVDYDYVQMLAHLAEQNRVRQFLLVSALGANSKSALLYNRVKGRIEDTVSVMRFAGIHIFRPSLLLGPRGEARRGEDLAKRLLPPVSPLLLGKLRRYRPVQARDLAAAMIATAKRGLNGTHLHYMHQKAPAEPETEEDSAPQAATPAAEPPRRPLPQRH